MKNTLWKNLLVLGALLSLAACGMESTASVQDNSALKDSSELEIIKGKEDPNDPAIVAILGQVEGQEGQMLCTGTLIAPNVVLTAAHCVDPDVLGGQGKFLVVTDWNLTDGDIPAANRLAVQETHFDPEFSKTKLTAGHDIAVVILEDKSDITPIKWNDGPLPDSLIGSKVRIVGYGLSDGVNQTGAGIKREGMTKLSKFDNLLLKTGGMFSTRICNGDSGGPVLAVIDGVERVIGVNSFGFIFCIGAGNSTRVDTYSKFVEQYVH